MAWIEPVTDRTAADVEAAKSLLESWKGNMSEAYELKGCFNYQDMNRIEGNIQFLSDKFAENSFRVRVQTKTWTRDEAPTTWDVERTIDNLIALTDAFTGFQFPAIPEKMLTYQEINDIETILFQVNSMIDGLMKLFKKCNTFQAGSTVFLPLRR